MNQEMIITAVVAGSIQLGISWLSAMYLRSVLTSITKEIKAEVEARIIRLENLVMERGR